MVFNHSMESLEPYHCLFPYDQSVEYRDWFSSQVDMVIITIAICNLTGIEHPIKLCYIKYTYSITIYNLVIKHNSVIHICLCHYSVIE